MKSRIHHSKVRRFSSLVDAGLQAGALRRTGRGFAVAQIFNLLYRRIAFGRPRELRKAGRLQIRDTPDCNSVALRRQRRWNACWLVACLWVVAWHKVCAQLAPADAFFNGGAQFYISNNIPAALEAVTNGRALYPDDIKLKKLEELLKQQQQQQQQQQNQQSQQNQSEQQKDQQNQQQQNQKQNQQQQSQQQQNQSAQQKQQQNQSGEKTNDEQQVKAMQGKEMTPEEAKQLLDAQKGNEQVLQFKPQGKPEDQNRPVKDW